MRAAVCSRLGRFARVVMFDKRGTGLSDPVPEVPSLDLRMDDVRAVMDAVGVQCASPSDMPDSGFAATSLLAGSPTSRITCSAASHDARMAGVEKVRRIKEEVANSIWSRPSGLARPQNQKFIDKISCEYQLRERSVNKYLRWHDQISRPGQDPRKSPSASSRAARSRRLMFAKGQLDQVGRIVAAA